MNKPISCIVIEDQAPAQRILKSYIQDTPSLKLLNAFSNALEAQAVLQQQRVDLIFLDIHLPKLSGMDFLKTLDNPPQVILTTAFSEYAVQSYEYKVLDYLLKPFSFPRFIQAVNKVVEENKKLEKPNRTTTESFVYLKMGHETIKVARGSILYIHSDADYTELHTQGKKYLSSETLKHWIGLFQPQFVQVHKSYVVNREKVELLSTTFVQLDGNIKIPIGRAFKEGLKQELGWTD
jgi:DNA-binding LytR/AlgR family response regulator